MTDRASGAESLLDWMTGLVADPVARARFAADPQHELEAQGLADLDPADVAHALPLATDTVAARFDLVVDLPAVPPAGESAVDAVARHLATVPEVVEPPAEHDLDDWTESLVDDLAGAPDGLEGVVGAAPGVDLDLDGTGDLDGVHHDHDLDVMTRLDGDHDLDGTPATSPAAAPTLALVPSVDEDPGAAGDVGAFDGTDDGADEFTVEPEPDHHDGPDDDHEPNPDHAFDVHDLDVAP